MNRLPALALRALNQVNSGSSIVYRTYGRTSVLLSQAHENHGSTPMNVKNRFLLASIAFRLKVYDDRLMSPEEYTLAYGLYQRVSKGINNTPKPEESEKPEEVTKWESWSRCGEMSSEEAQEKFFTIMNAVRNRAGFGDFQV